MNFIIICYCETEKKNNVNGKGISGMSAIVFLGKSQ